MDTRTALFTVLPEPDLLFGPVPPGNTAERHDPQKGLLNHGPYGVRLGSRWHPKTVSLYTVASESDWDTCVSAASRLLDFERIEKVSGRTRVDYPGFRSAFHCDLKLVSDRGRQCIADDDFAEAVAMSSPAAGYRKVISVFERIVDGLGHLPTSAVLFVHLPAEIIEKFHRFDPEFQPVEKRAERNQDKNQMVLFEELAEFGDKEETLFNDLRRSLKTLCMRRKVAIQIVTPGFVNEDEDNPWAGKLWNISTSIFCKAGGIPWRLAIDEDVAYCGIRFGVSKGQGGQSILVGLAQLVNASGQLVALKTGQATRGDRRSEVGYYLTRDQARTLLDGALRDFESVTGYRPRRIVVHKSSPFKPDEIGGMKEAAAGIRDLDLVYLKFDTSIRLLPERGMPADRGSLVPTTDWSAILYTCGHVPQHEKWRGLHIPNPMEIVRARSSRPLRSLAIDVLRLTKMNWNSTVYDSYMPCTFSNATEMIGMMKEMREDEPLDAHVRYYI